MAREKEREGEQHALTLFKEICFRHLVDIPAFIIICSIECYRHDKGLAIGEKVRKIGLALSAGACKILRLGQFYFPSLPLSKRDPFFCLLTRFYLLYFSHCNTFHAEEKAEEGDLV
jgi:hypothetical protein